MEGDGMSYLPMVLGKRYKSVGRNVRISPLASMYGTEFIEIGDNVRIDDFCIISSKEEGIKIGNHIHIGAHTTIVGDSRIVLEDFSQIAHRCAILSSTDDFSGSYAVGPQMPFDARKVWTAPVTIKRHAVLGINTVIMPGVTVGENAATGAFTFVEKDIPDGVLHIGIPDRYYRDRLPKKLTDQDYIDQMDWYK